MGIEKEFYFLCFVDCVILRVVFIVFIEGGMDIEEVVVKMFEKILILMIDLVIGVMGYYGCLIVFVLGLKGD